MGWFSVAQGGGGKWIPGGPREAQRGSQRAREVQRVPESTKTPREIQRSPESLRGARPNPTACPKPGGRPFGLPLNAFRCIKARHLGLRIEN